MKRVIALLLCLTVPSVALADDPRRFPDSVQLSHAGTTYRAFDLGNFRALLQMDADLTAALAELALAQTQLAEAREAYENQGAAVQLLEQNLTAMTAERNRLLLQWQDLDEQFQECNERPRVTPFLAWVITAVSLSASIGVTTYFVLRK